MKRLRRLAARIARTPLHPQWLLGARHLPDGLSGFRGRVLDVGAADRWIQPRLAPGTAYVALDLPATGRDLYGGRPDIYADAARLPLVDGCMDGVVCLEVLEHVPDPAEVLAEIARVLRPGGEAWLSMPFLYPAHDEPYDFQRYTAHGLRRDVARAGLDLTHLRKTGHSIRTAGLLACLALAGGVGRFPAAVQWLVAPLVAFPVLLVNCLAYAVSLVWPDWTALGTGHEVRVRKP